MQEQNPQDHGPENPESQPRRDDLRETRLNRVPIDQPQPDAPEDPPDHRPPPPVGGFGDTGDRFSATDYSRSDERYDERYDSSYGSSGGSMYASGGASGDEKTWSVLAHLSILVSLLTGIGGFVAALVIWLVYKDRSPRIGFHALQSLWYQVAWTGIIIAFGVVATVLSFVTFGLAAVVLIPLGILLAFVPFVHQCYAAYKVSQGVDYRYPIIADMIDGSRRFG